MAEYEVFVKDNDRETKKLASGLTRKQAAEIARNFQRTFPNVPVTIKEV